HGAAAGGDMAGNRAAAADFVVGVSECYEKCALHLTPSITANMFCDMELKLAVICEAARERPDGRVDIIGVFDELHAPAFPAVQERMTVVFVMEWSAEEEGDQPFRANLVHESGRKILGIEGHTVVSAGPSGRAVTRL